MKKNNNGFSLVELIIVVAILAVLVALLAPQYFQYVERSRKAVDVNTASEVLQAVKVAVIDPDNKVNSTITVEWTPSTAGAASIACDNAGVDSAVGTVIQDSKAAKSAFAAAAGKMTVTATYNANTGFTFTVTSAADASDTVNRWEKALG